MTLLPIAAQVFILHLGVYYGLRRFNKWEAKQQQKLYNKVLSNAKPKARK